MSYQKMAVISAVAVVLAGCSHNTDYLREAQTVPPLVVPSTVSMKPTQNYYPVPNTPVNTTIQPPSLLPPGSNLGRFTPPKKQQALAEPAAVVEPIQTAALSATLKNKL